MAETSMKYDVLVIGAGIAGASLAYELVSRTGSSNPRVALLEAEDTTGYHSTGRSVALFSECYGHRVVRTLSKASRAFFDSPPAGFADHPLMTPRGVLFLARKDQKAVAERLFEDTRALARRLEIVDGPRAREINPVLDPTYVHCCVHEPDAMDLDVNAVHEGYLRGAKAGGAALITGARVQSLDRTAREWRVGTSAGTFSAERVVNAAGAWADQVAERAGARALGLVALRRTVIAFDAPAGSASDAWPMTIDCDEQFYIKPETGRLLGSPADQTPVPPSDVQPDELDIAHAVDRIERATTLRVQALTHKWAGLRSFFADKLPAVGPDAGAEGLFWLAGQGGYGIMTAPAMARLAAAHVSGGDMPAELTDLGFEAAALLPARLTPDQMDA